MKRMGSGGLSHRTIARLLGISHTRVQQIERKALRKLRKALSLLEWRP